MTLQVEVICQTAFYHAVDKVLANPTADLYVISQGHGSIIAVYNYETKLIWSRPMQPPCVLFKWSTDGNSRYDI